MNGAILRAYGFDGQGGGEVLEGDQISREIKAKRFAWVHLDALNPQTLPWLIQEVGYLDPHVPFALTAEETRPRATFIKDGVLVILRGVNLNEQEHPEDMVSIRLWIDPYRIISVRKRPLKITQDLGKSLLAGKGPKNAGTFLCALVSGMFARFEPFLGQLEDEIDSLEEQILDSPDTALRGSIVALRKQALMFRRYMAPQRDVLDALGSTGLTWLKDTDKRHLQENRHQVLRYLEDLDALRERSQIIADELSAQQSEKLNKNMYILSVIAAVFLPLGFLTGLLGINVGGIPGADYDGAFFIFCSFLLALVLAQVCFFKFRKWF